MSLDLNRDTFGVVYFALSELVVTTAFILTFSPAEKGQRLQASLYAVVRRANTVYNARCARRIVTARPDFRQPDLPREPRCK